jgi:predicted enzyme related to lactoylglutathione lyase
MLAAGSQGLAAQASPTGNAPVAAPAEKVVGIGGFFFRAANPKAVADWYERNLGINLTPTSYDGDPWRQEAGITIFAPFAATTKYFGRESQQWMINFRVRDLDAMAAQLRRAGIAVEIDKETYPNGRFARLADPEGNPIQLWQPMNERKN